MWVLIDRKWRFVFLVAIVLIISIGYEAAALHKEALLRHYLGSSISSLRVSSLRLVRRPCWSASSDRGRSRSK
jgi:hypothetical protein